jgi:hypothetical protein
MKVAMARKVSVAPTKKPLKALINPSIINLLYADKKAPLTLVWQVGMVLQGFFGVLF